MQGTSAGFVDAGYLIAEGAKAIDKRPAQVLPRASYVTEWLSGQASGIIRTYWYDGALATTHPAYEKQRRYFDAIAYTPGIQLRLGHLVERQSRLEGPMRRALRTTANGLGIPADQLIAEFDKNWTFYPDRQQKGVDTLMTLDMVRLASRSAFETAIVISGDRDLAEVIRTVQDYGVRVIVATPNRTSVASEVLQLADNVIDIGQDAIQKMLTARPSGTE